MLQRAGLPTSPIDGSVGATAPVSGYAGTCRRWRALHVCPYAIALADVAALAAAVSPTFKMGTLSLSSAGKRAGAAGSSTGAGTGAGAGASSGTGTGAVASSRGGGRGRGGRGAARGRQPGRRGGARARDAPPSGSDDGAPPMSIRIDPARVPGGSAFADDDDIAGGGAWYCCSWLMVSACYVCVGRVIWF